MATPYPCNPAHFFFHNLASLQGNKARDHAFYAIDWPHLSGGSARTCRNPPRAMRPPRETAGHPIGTIKSWMGATHFLMEGLRVPIRR
jgi:hypothetical protein